MMTLRRLFGGLLGGTAGSAAAAALAVFSGPEGLMAQNAEKAKSLNLKITGLKTFLVAPNGIYVKVYTNQGLIGLGQAHVDTKEASTAQAIMENEPLLMGRGPHADREDPAGHVHQPPVARGKSISQMVEYVKAMRKAAGPEHEIAIHFQGAFTTTEAMATFHYSAATSNFTIQELRAHTTQYNMDLHDGLIPVVKNGYGELPNRPGLGAVLNEKVAAKFPFKGWVHGTVDSPFTEGTWGFPEGPGGPGEAGQRRPPARR